MAAVITSIPWAATRVSAVFYLSTARPNSYLFPCSPSTDTQHRVQLISVPTDPPARPHTFLFFQPVHQYQHKLTLTSVPTACTSGPTPVRPHTYLCSHSLATNPQHSLTIGDVVSDATALRSSELGLSLRLSDKCVGFCPLSQVPGVTKAKSMALKYRPGTRAPCKVIAFNPMDQLFIVTLDSTRIKNEVTFTTVHMSLSLYVVCLLLACENLWYKFNC